MNAVFAGTAFYVALLSSRDELHPRAIDFLSGFSGRILTTEFILLEVANVYARPADRQPFLVRRNTDKDNCAFTLRLHQAGLEP